MLPLHTVMGTEQLVKANLTDSSSSDFFLVLSQNKRKRENQSHFQLQLHTAQKSDKCPADAATEPEVSPPAGTRVKSSDLLRRLCLFSCTVNE